MSVSAGNLLLRMVVTLLCILWLLAVVRPNVRANPDRGGRMACPCGAA